jgi:RNase H-like domain found in reverse transcriptase
MFKELKRRFIEIPILVYFNLEKEVIVKYNTLDKAISGTLSQKDKKRRIYLIVYYLRKFITIKLNYDIYNKELLVIVEYLR